ncbi:BamA/TamA family outer membrane protein [Undibacterium piscinae]|uniref:BamA/TamA family outer membrane protein n=1 Tax=Undibacterium piscinae TaxID=2495591 RepID=A0A6M4A7F2_9BURK|nr:BamA/TamA family outer membrane protein [Undibacterium piscinae]
MNYSRFFCATPALLLLLSVADSCAVELALNAESPSISVADLTLSEDQQVLVQQKKTEAEQAEPMLEPDADADEEQQDFTLAATSTLIRFRIGQANGEWLELLQEHIPEFAKTSEAQSLTPGVLKKIRNAISSILATEGYFSPVIRFEKENQGSKLVLVNIDAGQRSIVQSLNLRFSGALADAANAGQESQVRRRDNLIADWSLPQGAPFRDAEWGRAKNKLLENLRDESFAAARIEDSSATIDADKHSAALVLEIASGPPFILGDLNITGLQRYPNWLLERYAPPKKGEPYSRSRLLEYQRALQNSPYFSTVAVSVDADTSKADAAPVEVAVVERRARDIAIGAGYSTNTGLRTELTYRDRHLFDRAWDLRSAVRIEQKRQLAYADIYLPPTEKNQLDSFGVLNDHSDLSGLMTTRSAFGIKRTTTKNKLEQRLGLNLAFESSQLRGEIPSVNRALVASIGWTWRDVDNNFAPRKGQIAQFDLAASEKTLLSNQRFVRSYGKYQRWIPVGERDSVVLRGELGQVVSAGSEGIPEDYLFRTGGSTTVRGYAYQSLGIQHPGGVTGGRVLAVASAEYVHWLDASWGSAAFLDVGDAADTWRDYSGKSSYGVGARYMTPAGPIALDLAYATKSKKIGVEFSIAIAF